MQRKGHNVSTHPEVLAVDDDAAFLGSLKAYFAHQGIAVLTLSDAIAAAAINYARFKVVLLDLDMPDFTGQQIVRELPEKNRPLVIIVSGHCDRETRVQLLDQGADFFVSKPVDLGELHLIVKRALGRTNSPADGSDRWVLSKSKLSLTTPGGVSLGLAGSEYRVLEQLFLQAPNAAPKEDLAVAAAGQAEMIGANYSRSLEVMISRMRTRFSAEAEPLPIKSLRNLGYVFHGNGTVE